MYVVGGVVKESEVRTGVVSVGGKCLEGFRGGLGRLVSGEVL